MSNTAVIDEQTIKQEALTVVQKAQIVKIVDQESYEGAVALLLDQIKPFRKRWAEYWSQPKEAAYRAYKSILAKFQEGDEPLEKAENQVKAAISAWTQEQERRRQQLQREAEEAARKAQEEELARAAAVAEESGATEEEVEQMIAQAPQVVAAPIQPTYEKASGVSTRELWSARVTDIKKLCAAVAKGTVPVSYVEPNMVALNQRAKADKNTLNVPGVIAVKEISVAGRTR